MESTNAEVAATLRKRPLSTKTSGAPQDGKMDDQASSSSPPPSLVLKEKLRVSTDHVRGDQVEEPMSPAGRLFHEPHFNCYIIAIMGIARPIDVDAVRAGLEATLARHPRFSSIPVFDKSNRKKPRWVGAKVNIYDHFVIPDLDPTAISTNPDKVLEDYVASLSTSPPLPFSRPLWELHVLNFPTSESAASAVLRIHHSLGDGTSLISLLFACTRSATDPTALPALPPAPKRVGPVFASPRPPPHAGLFAFVAWLLSFVVLAWHTVVDVTKFFATLCVLKDTETVFKGVEGVEFHQKRFVHRTLSLDDVKHVKGIMKCTVNDVLIGITSAALSRYYYRKYGELDIAKRKNLEKNVRVRSTLLVNLRPTPGVQELAKMMEKGNKDARWGNHLGYMILPFPIVKYDDPLDYVRKGRAIATRKKNSLEAMLTYLTADVIVKFFGTKTASALSHQVLCNTTLSFSNLVGPVEQIIFCGHPLVYIAPSVCGHPQVLTVHFQSYMNTVKVVLAVDDSKIPDPHELLDDFAESLKLIRAAADSKGT